mgnify:CR=1 FL=1
MPATRANTTVPRSGSLVLPLQAMSQAMLGANRRSNWRRSALRTALVLLVVLLGTVAALPAVTAQTPVPQVAWWPCRAPWPMS